MKYMNMTLNKNVNDVFGGISPTRLSKESGVDISQEFDWGTVKTIATGALILAGLGVLIMAISKIFKGSSKSSGSASESFSKASNSNYREEERKKRAEELLKEQQRKKEQDKKDNTINVEIDGKDFEYKVSKLIHHVADDMEAKKLKIYSVLDVIVQNDIKFLEQTIPVAIKILENYKTFMSYRGHILDQSRDKIIELRKAWKGLYQEVINLEDILDKYDVNVDHDRLFIKEIPLTIKPLNHMDAELKFLESSKNDEIIGWIDEKSTTKKLLIGRMSGLIDSGITIKDGNLAHIINNIPEFSTSIYHGNDPAVNRKIVKDYYIQLDKVLSRLTPNFQKLTKLCNNQNTKKFLDLVEYINKEENKKDYKHDDLNFITDYDVNQNMYNKFIKYTAKLINIVQGVAIYTPAYFVKHEKVIEQDIRDSKMFKDI